MSGEQVSETAHYCDCEKNLNAINARTNWIPLAPGGPRPEPERENDGSNGWPWICSGRCSDRCFISAAPPPEDICRHQKHHTRIPVTQSPRKIKSAGPESKTPIPKMRHSPPLNYAFTARDCSVPLVPRP